MRPILIIAGVVIAIPVIAVIALAFLLANPESYREQLKETVAAEAGYQIEIGDLNWRYWPPIAMNLADVSVTVIQRGKPLAKLGNATVDLDLMPLLTSGTLNINALTISDVSIDARVNKRGRDNWTPRIPGSSTPATAPGDAAPGEAESAPEPATPSGSSLGLLIENVEVNNINVRYSDHRDGSQYKLKLDQLTTSTIAWDEMMTVAMDLVMEDVAGDMKIETDIQGALSIDQSLSRFNVDKLQLANRLQVPDLPKTDVTLIMSGAIDLAADTANLSNLQVILAGLEAGMEMQVTELTGDLPKFKGKIDTNVFDANALLAALEQPAIETAGENRLSKVSLAAQVEGTPNKISLQGIRAQLDDSEVTGRADITPGEITGLNFNLVLGKIVASDYLPPEETEEVSASPAPAAAGSGGKGAGDGKRTKAAPAVVADSEIIPVDLLKTLDVDGSFAIKELVYDTYTFSDFNLSIRNTKNILRTNMTLKGYDGEIQNRSETRYARVTRTKNTLTVRGINLATLAETESITGHITMDAEHNMRGKMLSGLMNSVTGDATFAVENGTLDVTAIKSLAQTVDGLRGKTSSVSEWPDKKPFDQLQGSHTLDKGTRANQQLDFTLENIEVAGTGGFDYFANTMNYDIGIQFAEAPGAEFDVGESLAGIRWPIRCEGPLDGSPADTCRPDSGAAKDIVADIAKQELKRQGKKELDKLIGDKVPEGAKDLLKGLLGN